MPHKSFSSILLHITWHTQGNQDFLEPDVSEFVIRVIRQKCLESREVLLLEAGGTPNHIHLAIKIPPTIMVAKLIGEFKGSSSYAVKKLGSHDGFGWQDGYGVLSFSDNDRKFILEYIQNQVERHRQNKTVSNLEKSEA